MNHTVLALGCLYKVQLWQFLESRWFGLASVPSSVSFECLLHNVSWLESLLSWGSSRKDFGSSEWRWMSAVFPIIVKKCPAKATHVYFGSRFKGAVHHGWEGLANVLLHLQNICTAQGSLVLNSLYLFIKVVWIPTHGPVPPTFRVGPLALVNPI